MALRATQSAVPWIGGTRRCQLGARSMVAHDCCLRSSAIHRTARLRAYADHSRGTVALDNAYVSHSSKYSVGRVAGVTVLDSSAPVVAATAAAAIPCQQAITLHSNMAKGVLKYLRNELMAKVAKMRAAGLQPSSSTEVQELLAAVSKQHAIVCFFEEKEQEKAKSADLGSIVTLAEACQTQLVLGGKCEGDSCESPTTGSTPATRMEVNSSSSSSGSNESTNLDACNSSGKYTTVSHICSSTSTSTRLVLLGSNNIVPAVFRNPTMMLQASSTTAPTAHSSKAWSLNKVFVAASEDRGKRKYMEDRHTLATLCSVAGPIDDWLGGVSLDSQLAYAAVFDGHGGHMTAAHAARHFHHVVHRTLHKADPSHCSGSSSRGGGSSQGSSSCQTQQAAVRRAFLKHDEEWRQQTSGMQFDGSGSTAVVALVNKKNLVIGNTGDSVAVLARGGAPLRLSELHKPDSEEEAARVVAAGGRVWNSKGVLRVMQEPATLPVAERYVMQPTLAVTRALGDFKLKRRAQPIVSAEPACRHLELIPDDALLLLASDGITDVMSDEQMVEVALETLHQAGTRAESQQDLAQTAAAAVTAKALQLGAWDNITAVAMLLDWIKPKP